jgi:TusA-related sulfurtransferase
MTANDNTTPIPPSADKTLDVRTTKCPLNFVKARLALDKLADGQVLEVWLAPDSDTLNTLPISLRQEGHVICVYSPTEQAPYHRIIITKQADSSR